MMYWSNHMDGGDYLIMAVYMVVFWGLLIAGVVLLVRQLGGHQRSTPPAPQPNPRQVLDERFARGEIDEDEYRKRLQVLTGR